MGWVWWCTALVPVLRRQRKAELCDSGASLVYHSKFQNSQGRVERSCFKSSKQQQQQQSTQETRPYDESGCSRVSKAGCVGGL